MMALRYRRGDSRARSGPFVYLLGGSARCRDLDPGGPAPGRLRPHRRRRPRRDAAALDRVDGVLRNEPRVEAAGLQLGDRVAIAGELLVVVEDRGRALLVPVPSLVQAAQQRRRATTGSAATVAPTARPDDASLREVFARSCGARLGWWSRPGARPVAAATTTARTSPRSGGNDITRVGSRRNPPGADRRSQRPAAQRPPSWRGGGGGLAADQRRRTGPAAAPAPAGQTGRLRRCRARTPKLFERTGPTCSRYVAGAAAPIAPAATAFGRRRGSAPFQPRDRVRVRRHPGSMSDDPRHRVDDLVDARRAGRAGPRRARRPGRLRDYGRDREYVVRRHRSAPTTGACRTSCASVNADGGGDRPKTSAQG